MYRIVDKYGKDIFIRNKHPIEILIFTKKFFEGRLAGWYKWESDKKNPFVKELKKGVVWKELQEIKKIRKNYDE